MIDTNSNLPVAIPITADGPDADHAKFATTITTSADVANQTKDAVYLGDKPPSNDGSWHPVLISNAGAQPKAGSPDLKSSDASFDDSPISSDEVKNILTGLIAQQVLHEAEKRVQMEQLRELTARLLVNEALDNTLKELRAEHGDGQDDAGTGTTDEKSDGTQGLADRAYRAAVVNELSDKIKDAVPTQFKDDDTRAVAKNIVGDELKKELADPANTTPDAVADAASKKIIDRFNDAGISDAISQDDADTQELANETEYSNPAAADPTEPAPATAPASQAGIVDKGSAPAPKPTLSVKEFAVA